MKIGFLGAGNLARAMVQALLQSKLCQPNDISCLSGAGQTAKTLSEDTGIVLASSRQALFQNASIIVLAFKPQHLETVTKEEGSFATDKLIVSVLAGRTIQSLSDVFPSATNIARVMPNTPSKIGKGVSAYCYAKPPSKEESEKVEKLLNSFGSSYEIEESEMHIATALSGCGPAVFFQFIDSLAKAAEKRGMPKKLSLEVAIKTGLGSLELMKQSDQDPQELIDEVVSPNGVTHALLESLKASNWHGILDTAIEDAIGRSQELAGE